MPKVTPQKVLITFVALYGGYRIVKSAQKRRALSAGPSSPALPAANPQRALAPGASSPFANPNPVVDWRQAGTPERINTAIRDALRLDGATINSSRELAYAAGARLWPGLSIHPSGLRAVQDQIRRVVRWPDAPNTDENHEACVRMTARVDYLLSEALDLHEGSAPMTVIQDTVASSIFTEREWPPEADAPEWCHEVWSRIGFMVDQALRERGRLPSSEPVAGEAAERDDGFDAPGQDGEGEAASSSEGEAPSEEAKAEAKEAAEA